MSQQPQRRISYDRTTRDYAYFCDEQLLGFEPTYHDAEIALDKHIANLLTKGTAPVEQPVELELSAPSIITAVDYHEQKRIELERLLELV